LQVGASAAGMALVGYLIDRWLGSSPWGVLIGMMLGLIGGFYNFIKEVSKAMR